MKLLQDDSGHDPIKNGQCCCNCALQYEIAVCSCPVCSDAVGFICMMLAVEDGNRQVTHKYSSHGICECWRERKQTNKTCTWKIHDSDNGIWETECGNLFVFTEGDPSENKFKYCPYCGNELIELK